MKLMKIFLKKHIGIVILLAIYVPYFYAFLIGVIVLLVIGIIGSHDNPDYKIPWILVVILLPIVGMMLYFIFNVIGGASRLHLYSIKSTP